MATLVVARLEEDCDLRDPECFRSLVLIDENSYYFPFGSGGRCGGSAGGDDLGVGFVPFPKNGFGWLPVGSLCVVFIIECPADFGGRLKVNVLY